MSQRVDGKWKFGKFSYLIQEQFDLSPEELSREVREILTEKKYRNHAQILQGKVKHLGGAKIALDSLEKLFQ